ncbi:MAG: DUF427 domain-containing protein [Gammaproteobacteria bacterium]|nr:DUF427 domain-containing protein [Gammaproteobacteria bacterium]
MNSRSWQHRGQKRPEFAATPAAGQESVWDYPRPPAYVRDERAVRIQADGQLLAKADQSIRALETGSPPAFYLPPDAFDHTLLIPSSRRTFCEWKGEAKYYDVVTPQRTLEAAVWRYPAPLKGAEIIAGWLSCYPEQLECFVGDEAVLPQEGRYYGGWVTSELVGPWKGEPGTGHW